MINVQRVLYFEQPIYTRIFNIRPHSYTALLTIPY